MAKATTGDVPQFIKELQDTPPNSSVFTGMAKACDEDPSALMFAHAGDCSHWVKIPASAILRVEKLGLVGCEGHYHQAVHLIMVAPKSDEAAAFASMADLQRTKLLKTQVALNVMSANASGTSLPGCSPMPPMGCPPNTFYRRDPANGQEFCCP